MKIEEVRCFLQFLIGRLEQDSLNGGYAKKTVRDKTNIVIIKVATGNLR